MGNATVDHPSGIPSDDDWNFESRDYSFEWAYKRFSGKDLHAAERMFRENGSIHCEDLLDMPPRPFRFYFDAMVNVLEAVDFEQDFDCGFVDGFIRVVLARSGDLIGSEHTVAKCADRIVSFQNNTGECWEWHGWYADTLWPLRDRGFPFSFSTIEHADPPPSVRLHDVARANKTVPLQTARIILERSGITLPTPTTEMALRQNLDSTRLFQCGQCRTERWIRTSWLGVTVRFGFGAEGDEATSVTFFSE